MRRDGAALEIGWQAYNLGQIRRVLLVGAGKAGAPMAQAAAAILGEHLSQGLVIVKEGYTDQSNQLPPYTVIEAGHPVPDERGVQGAQRIRELLGQAQADDLVICLISGGGSALLVSPVEGVSLADLQDLTGALLGCGASINEINTLRKHLEQLKGGGLARLAAPAQVAALALSDVIGDPLEVIASGPTSPDPSTFQEAMDILQGYGLLEKAPPGVLAHLRRGLAGAVSETPKAEDKIFANVHNVIIGSNRQAAQAALEMAQSVGYNTLLLTTRLQGEARQAGRFLAAIARQTAVSGQPLSKPACLITGGETTVTLSSSAAQGGSLGGRNQELALGAASDLAGLPGVLLVTLATDGGDGPTDAAGAAVTGETLQRARQLGLDPQDFLERNDAYHFFERLGDLLKTGPTNTNVNDLTFIFAE